MENNAESSVVTTELDGNPVVEGTFLQPCNDGAIIQVLPFSKLFPN